MGVSYIALSAGATSRIWFTGSLIKRGILRFDDSFICSAVTLTLPVRSDFIRFAFGILSLIFVHLFSFLSFAGWTITPSSFGASFSRSLRETLRWSSRTFRVSTSLIKDLIWFQISRLLDAWFVGSLLSQIHPQLQYKGYHLSHYHSRQDISQYFVSLLW